MSTSDPVSPEVQARILAEALPYMQRYDEEIVVVKYGGHAMGSEHLAREFARDIVLLEQTAIMSYRVVKLPLCQKLSGRGGCL